MVITNGYCTQLELKQWLNADDPALLDDLDDLIDAAINAVSRYFDRKCKRHFYMTEQARVFAATGAYILAFGHFEDLTTVTPVTVKTDDDGDGVFETTWLDSEYQLRPPNVVATSEPYRALRGVQKRFPVNITVGGRAERIEVTGTWGWPVVPDGIHQATKIQAARIVKRREAPEGILGLNQFGVLRVSGRMDPDVRDLISPYRLRSLG